MFLKNKITKILWYFPPTHHDSLSAMLSWGCVAFFLAAIVFASSIRTPNVPHHLNSTWDCSFFQLKISLPPSIYTVNAFKPSIPFVISSLSSPYHHTCSPTWNSTAACSCKPADMIYKVLQMSHIPWLATSESHFM